MASIKNVSAGKKLPCPLMQNVIRQSAKAGKNIMPACNAFHAARNLKVK
jgi:hypothetical protein